MDSSQSKAKKKCKVLLRTLWRSHSVVPPCCPPSSLYLIHCPGEVLVCIKHQRFHFAFRKMGNIFEILTYPGMGKHFLSVTWIQDPSWDQRTGEGMGDEEQQITPACKMSQWEVRRVCRFSAVSDAVVGAGEYFWTVFQANIEVKFSISS